MLSLLLCLTVVVVWTGSYRVRTTLGRRTWRIHEFMQERHSFEIELGCGVLGIRSVTDVDPGALIFPDGSIHYAKPQPDDLRGLRLTTEQTNVPLLTADDTPLERLGFLHLRKREGRSEGYSDIDFVFVPVWLLSAGLGLMPATAAVALFRRSRQADGHCSACGYDLRASTDRCPECGAPVPAMAGETGTSLKYWIGIIQKRPVFFSRPVFFQPGKPGRL
ncbi:MAG TPA: zinc ribbon domain-containing protein [Tepidisphaeraceae bacterium]